MPFAPGPRDPATPGLCGAKARQNGGAPCKNFAMRPLGRCRLHGGRSRFGFTAGTYVHGRYSQDFLTRLMADALQQRDEQVARATQDPTAEDGGPSHRCDTPQAPSAPDTPCNTRDPMTVHSRHESTAVAGVTHRGRGRGAGADHPGLPTRSPRFQPPTPEQVGRAAALCFQDADSDEQIAHRLGIARRTLARWKQRSDFAAALAALQIWTDDAP